MSRTTINLNWPPSGNHRVTPRARSKRLTNKESYRAWMAREVGSIIVQRPHRFNAGERLEVLLHVYPPDRRRRDLDNLLKAILDVLAHAGVFKDDFQVWDLRIVRKGIENKGRVQALITSLEDPCTT